MRRWLGGLLCILVATTASAELSSVDLQARQALAKKQREQLQQRIAQVQKNIDEQEGSRKDAAQALKDSETAISDINRRLEELKTQTGQVQDRLASLSESLSENRKAIAARRDELASQLRAQYAGGLSPWAALLSGDDPQSIGRELSYLGYVSSARAQAVKGLQDELHKQAELESQLKDRQAELKKLQDEARQRANELDEQKARRAKVLADIEQDLKQQRAKADTLQQDNSRLEKLVDGLQDAIKAQREVERKERERLEAERRERERKAREAADQARKAQQAAEQAARQEREAERRRDEAVASSDADSSASQAAARSTPDGLSKGLPAPVKGEVQGRFGAQRPDGGVWRGIVLRVPEGTRVHPVAPGRIVYAGWFNGFGNLMIIDHGKGFLTVYAYNQSLLRKVGDRVGPADAIATVGSTGGQVEPGLYFEIRQNGAPVNPLLWLAR